jgi:hypothetical protein
MISLPLTTERKKMERQKIHFHSKKQQIPPTSHRAKHKYSTKPTRTKLITETKNGPLSPTTAPKLERSLTFSNRYQDSI